MIKIAHNSSGVWALEFETGLGKTQAFGLKQLSSNTTEVTEMGLKAYKMSGMEKLFAIAGLAGTEDKLAPQGYPRIKSIQVLFMELDCASNLELVAPVPFVRKEGIDVRISWNQTIAAFDYSVFIKDAQGNFVENKTICNAADEEVRVNAWCDVTMKDLREIYQLPIGSAIKAKIQVTYRSQTVLSQENSEGPIVQSEPITAPSLFRDTNATSDE